MTDTQNAGSYLMSTRQNSLSASQGFIHLLEFLQSLLTSWPFHLCILLILSMAIFGRTLTSYFIADDFGEILYVSQIFAGRWDLFWSNFTGNYMQVPGMAVYRPWLLVTLITDFFLWQGNAFGYYLTNLIYFCLDVLLVYVVARLLSSEWKSWEAGIASFCAAALFAASPLHCESISWVVGRVDSACCFYYLLAFLSCAYYHGSKQKPALIAAVILFCLALTTKEMAIGLPVVVSAYAFFQADKAYRKPGEFRFSRLLSLKEKLEIAWKTSRILWLVTIIYFIIRFLALGTFTGGYLGSIGEGQLASLLSRWTDVDTIKRLFFPFAYDLFQHKSYFFYLTLASYAGLAFLFLIRFLSLGINFTLLAFLAIWALTTLAPIYHLWGLGYNLEGERFCFFLTVPLSIMAPLLLFAPETEQSKLSMSSLSTAPTALFQLLRNLSFLPLIALIVVFAKAAYVTNLLWVHAGKEVKHLCLQSEILARQLPEQQKAIVLGLPKRRSGAHMILNGITYNMMLGPPFLKESCQDKFITFEPILFGHDELINPTRFRTQLSEPETAGVWLWDSTAHQFKELVFSGALPPGTTAALNDPSLTPGRINRNDLITANPAQPSADPLEPRLDHMVAVPLTSTNDTQTDTQTATTPASAPALFHPQSCLPASMGHALATMKQAELQLTSIKEGDGIRLTALNLNPLHVDYLAISIESSLDLKGQTVVAYWNDIQQQQCELLGDERKIGASEQLTLTEKAGTGTLHKYLAFVPLSRYWRWYTGGAVKSIFLQLPAVETLSVSNLTLIGAEAIVPTLQVLARQYDNRGVISLSEGKVDFQATSPAENNKALKIQISRANFFFYNRSTPPANTIYKEIPVPADGRFSLQASDLANPGYYEVRLAMPRPDGAVLYSDSVILSR